MHALLADLSRWSAESLPDAPELEAQIRTLQLVRGSEVEFESVVAIFRLLRAWQEIHSHLDDLNDIIFHPCRVFDARRLDWFERAIRIGLQIESEVQMPTIDEALIERGVEKGIEKGVWKHTHSAESPSATGCLGVGTSVVVS